MPPGHWQQPRRGAFAAPALHEPRIGPGAGPDCLLRQREGGCLRCPGGCLDLRFPCNKKNPSRSASICCTFQRITQSDIVRSVEGLCQHTSVVVPTRRMKADCFFSRPVCLISHLSFCKATSEEEFRESRNNLQAPEKGSEAEGAWAVPRAGMGISLGMDLAAKHLRCFSSELAGLRWKQKLGIWEMSDIFLAACLCCRQFFKRRCIAVVFRGGSRRHFIG